MGSGVSCRPDSKAVLLCHLQLLMICYDLLYVYCVENSHSFFKIFKIFGTGD